MTVSSQTDRRPISAEMFLRFPVHVSVMFNGAELGGDKGNVSGLRHQSTNTGEESSVRSQYYTMNDQVLD